MLYLSSNHRSVQFLHLVASEGEISAELKLWTPEKEDKLVAAWQSRECLFNITSCNYSNRGMKEKRDHVYFVHPSTDISTNVSVDISAECRPTYRSSVGRYVDRDVSLDTSADISVEQRYVN